MSRIRLFAACADLCMALVPNGLALNVRSFAPPLRPSPLRMAALVVSFLFFGYFSVLTLGDRLGLLR